MMTDHKYKIYEKLASVLPYTFTLYDVELGKNIICRVDSRHGRDTISITGTVTNLDQLSDTFLNALNNKYPKENIMAKKKSSGFMGQVDLNPTPPIKASIKAPKAPMAMPVPKPKAPVATKPLPSLKVNMAPLPKKVR